MGIDRICPRCGNPHVQLIDEKPKYGCLWTLLFGIYYVIWVIIKFVIGTILFFCYDWWMAIIKKCLGKGHVWQCRKWLGFTKRYYYCHNCGYNFKA